MMFRPRMATLALALVSVTAGTVVSGSGTAQASVSNEICTNEPSSSQFCYNDKQGIDNYGNPVIGWTKGDSNNNFFFQFLDFTCGDGFVTATCPFEDPKLNKRYAGDSIAAIQYGNTADACVGSTGNGSAELTACPDAFGNGGGFGTVVILSPLGPGGSDYIVNRHWSDINYGDGQSNSPAWECIYAKSAAILTNWPTGQSGPCTFIYYTN